MKYIFLPGFMCDERLFQPQMIKLKSSGYDCSFFAPDTQASIPEMARDILSSYNGPVFIIGLSMGGIIALEIALQAPKRVKGLAILNSTPFEDSLGEHRLEQIERVQKEGIEGLYKDELKPQYIAPQNRTHEIMDLVIDMAVQKGVEIFERQSLALVKRTSYENRLYEIQQSALILTGDADTVCGEKTARYLADNLANATLTCVENCGHLSTLEQPEAVNDALLRFVKKLKGA